MANTKQLSFLPQQRRKKRQIKMHVSDAGMFPNGDNGIEFECGRCGHNTGFILDTYTVGENRRGMPCPHCNEGDSQ